MIIYNNDIYNIKIKNNRDCLWSYELSSGRNFEIQAPIFSVDGADLEPVFEDIRLFSEKNLRNGQTEFIYEAVYKNSPDILLQIIFRTAPDNSIIKFCYILKSKRDNRLTKNNKTDALTYFKVKGDSVSRYKEVRFSAWSELVHSFCLEELPVSDKHFYNNAQIMGPMLLEENNNYSFLTAYEHGSEAPDAFLSFYLNENREIALKAVKGNYYDKQELINGYETIWFQLGGISGDEERLAEEYRSFQLKYASQNTESRKPYIYYNTWALQERTKEWENGSYADPVNLERMLREIDIAYKMGIDVFVIDAGWYDKTGKWTVNFDRFPDGMNEIKAKLSEYNMKLGLWFAPMAAYYKGDIYLQNKDMVMSKEGEYPSEDSAVRTDAWGAPPSFCMCISSKYWEVFADRLIWLYNTLGVTYFKWDALGQYGCCSPFHDHGTAENHISERRDCSAFLQVGHMAKIVEKLSLACPNAIVDFDITEPGRVAGLGFLSSGKFFLVNNGPYYDNYNITYDSENTWSNIFVNPGSARGWICRTPLTYDKWVPSTLFLTHYLADGDGTSQMQNIASLILGQNGIWGDLTKLSDDTVSLFNEILKKYKEVRMDITESCLIRMGTPGGSPEIYEKINRKSGKGAVVIFGNSEQSISYITSNSVSGSYWTKDKIRLKYDNKGRAVIDCTFTEASAKIIFFN